MPDGELAANTPLDFEILTAKQVNFQTAHTVKIPSRQLLSRQPANKDRIGWWTRDEGVKIPMTTPAQRQAALVDESFKYPQSDWLTVWDPDDPMTRDPNVPLREKILHRSQHTLIQSPTNWFAQKFQDEVAEHALTVNSLRRFG